MKYEKFKVFKEDINCIESLKAYTELRFKAPEGFTETVMRAVYKIKRPDAADMGIYISGLCKNLGASLILASFVMILSFFIPESKLYPPVDSQSGNAAWQTSRIKDSLSGMNDSIGNIFESIQKSVVKFKEGA